MLALQSLLQNRYRIESLLGKGGMGAVYRATDTRLSNVVALKETLFQDERLRRAFEREAKLLAGLFHPALPKVSDYFSEGDGVFLVMAYVPGEDLQQMAERQPGPFPLSQVLDWADQILDVLEYLHGQQPPIIHRDIKPANLKLTPDGRIILLDFGMARGGGGSSIAGYSVNYAPPEQIDQISTDARSDLYALGATLWHLLSGESPPNSVTRAMTVANGEPDPMLPVHRLNPGVPQEISGILHQAMALDRERRPASARVMRQMFREAAQPVLAKQSAKTLIPGGLGPTQLPGTRMALKVEAPPPLAATQMAETIESPVFHPQPAPVGYQSPPVSDFQPVQSEGPPPISGSFQPPAGPAVHHRANHSLLWAGVVAVLAIAGSLLAYRYIAGNSEGGGGVTGNIRGEVVALTLEVDRGGKTRKTTDEVTFKADEVFKFKLTPVRDVYLYLVAPGEDKTQTTFLTSQPATDTGLTSNRLLANQEFEFPAGKEHWIGLRDDSPTTRFTIILSPTQLKEPKFFARESGTALTAGEVKTFDEFCQENRVQLKRTVDSESVIRLALPESREAGKPIVFEIEVKREK
ncbi:MAG TPA: protein kinase [Acidobacteriota bacterium]|nr:protein kinase [Acidobacteriota bacterium]